MKVKVDAELCVGCGLCVNTCPDIFEMQDDKAILKSEAPSTDSEECCKQAKDDCPVEAIIIE
jgi:ferredoxin